MIEVGGVWLPQGETHLADLMRKIGRTVDGKLTYQYNKLEQALKWVKDFRVAVDVGAHVGLWSMHLAKRFSMVHSYEPVAAHRECFLRNCADVSENIHLHACALGDKEGSVRIHTAPTSSGDSWVAGEGDIPLRLLDANLEKHKVAHVDFIKIDCEGYELFVLRGAERTLRRDKPCIIVEQKRNHGSRFQIGDTDALTYLKSLGARLRWDYSGDYVFSWDK